MPNFSLVSLNSKYLMKVLKVKKMKVNSERTYSFGTPLIR